MDQTYILTDKGILEIADIVSNAFRWIGWGIIKILTVLVNGIEKTVTRIYTLNDFFNSREVVDLVNKYKPLIWTILAISICILGFRIMFNRQKNRNELPSNILYSILVVALIPLFMVKLNNITKVAVNSVGNQHSTLTDELVKNNVYDLYYLDSINFKLNGNKNNINKNNITDIDINEVIDLDEVSNKTVFEKKIRFMKDGAFRLVKLDKGIFKFDENYYRYNTEFLSVIVSLGAMAIALICVSLKVARLIIELAFNKLFATLLAFSDIGDGKKLKEIVKHIISIFMVIFATAIMTKLYILFSAWVTSRVPQNGVENNVLKLVLLVGGSLAVIDGPNIVERILGIDAGLKNSWSAVMAGYGLSKGTLNASKLLVSGAKSLGNGLALAGASALGGINGLSGNKDSKMNDSKADANKANDKNTMERNTVNSDESKNNNTENTTNKKSDTLEDEMERSNSNDSRSSENIESSSEMKNKITSDSERKEESKNNIPGELGDNSTTNIPGEINDGKGSNNIDNPKEDIKPSLEQDMILSDSTNKNISIGNNSEDSKVENTKGNKPTLEQEMKSSNVDDENRSIGNNSEIPKVENTKGNKPTLEQEMKSSNVGDKNRGGGSNSEIPKVDNTNGNKATLEQEMKSSNVDDKSRSLGNNSEVLKVANTNGNKPTLEQAMKVSNVEDKNRMLGNNAETQKMDTPKSNKETLNREMPLANSKIKSGNSGNVDINRNGNESNSNEVNKSNSTKGERANSSGIDEMKSNKNSDNIDGASSNIPGNMSKNESAALNGKNVESSDTIGKNNTPESKGNGERKNVKGKMEERTIGEFAKDKLKESRFVDDINRAYNLGYNTTNRWNIKSKKKNKKGGKK